MSRNSLEYFRLRKHREFIILSMRGNIVFKPWALCIALAKDTMDKVIEMPMVFLSGLLAIMAFPYIVFRVIAMPLWVPLFVVLKTVVRLKTRLHNMCYIRKVGGVFKIYENVNKAKK